MELSQLTENVSILTEKDPVIAGLWSVYWYDFNKYLL